MIKNLYQYALDKDIEIIECKLPITHLKGLYCDNVVYISDRIDTERELNCILAEEIGHFETSSGNILDQVCENNKKQELRARTWAHEHLLKIEDFIEAYRYGCRNQYELAEFLQVTEQFLIEAIETFKRKHGVCKVLGSYAVYFNPFGVMELFESNNTSEVKGFDRRTNT